MLIYAGALVGAFEFNQVIYILRARIGADDDLVGADLFDISGVLRADDDARVDSRLVFHAGRDDRRLRREQRHRLLLHIRAHQRARVVVVFEERNRRGRDRHDHLRRYVHVVGFLGVELDDLVSAATGYALVDEVTLVVERFVRLCYRVVVLDVGGHVYDLVGDDSLFLVYLAIRGFDEAVAVYLRVGREVGDKTNVRTFRGLNRAHTAVVCVVYVAHLERRAVTRQTARTERGQTALVRQLGERVVLVHELRQRRRAEELAYRGDDRTDVDKRVRSQRFGILRRHALLDRLVHAREADSHLILQKLADRTQTAVAEVVDIVLHADVVGKAGEVVYRRKDVVLGDMLRRQLSDATGGDLFEFVDIPADLLHDLKHYRELRALGDADIGKVAAYYILRLNHAVAEHLYDRLAVLEVEVDLIDAVVLDVHSLIVVEQLAFLVEQLTGYRGDDRRGELMTGYALADS